ncbi:MAG: hypothetical protein AAB340_02700 [Patescibacteria group bacterium]
MVQLIVFIIFIISLCGLLFILYRKIPALVKLPKNGHHGIKKPKIVGDLEKKIKDTHFHFFEKQMFLHRLLSKTKVWILKTETKIDHLLHSIRKKAQELDKKNGKK